MNCEAISIYSVSRLRLTKLIVHLGRRGFNFKIKVKVEVT